MMPDLVKLDLDAIITLFLSRLHETGRDGSSAPYEWIGTVFKAEKLEGNSRSDDSEKRRIEDLPSVVRAYRLDGKPVLFGDISASIDRSQLMELIRRYRNQAMITRSWIGNEATNVSLFLIGPLGSQDDALWSEWALEVELDEKVCRKIVWLPPVGPTPQDVDRFLASTALARPWSHNEFLGSEKLDSLAELGIPEHWLSLLQSEALDPDELVNILVQSLEPAGESYE
jgi:hypothetical protein